MKMEARKYWAKMESVGFPDLTKIIEGTPKEILFAFMVWQMSKGVVLNHEIRLRIVKEKGDLQKGKMVETSTDIQDMMAMIESQLNEEEQV